MAFYRHLYSTCIDIATFFKLLSKQTNINIISDEPSKQEVWGGGRNVLAHLLIQAEG